MSQRSVALTKPSWLGNQMVVLTDHLFAWLRRRALISGGSVRSLVCEMAAARPAVHRNRPQILEAGRMSHGGDGLEPMLEY